MQTLQGIAASPGLCWGKAFVHATHDLDSLVKADTFCGSSEESARLDAAISRTMEHLTALKEKTARDLGDESAHIFRSQQTILEDESTLEEIEELIRTNEQPATSAVKVVFDQYLALFAELDDEDYNKARAVDLSDVSRRLILELSGAEESSLAEIGAGTIVVAHELFPSDTALLDPRKVVGFITETGGLTSHVAILAKNLGIPAAVGVERALTAVSHGKQVFLDTLGSSPATVYVEPDEKTTKTLDGRLAEYRERQQQIRKDRGKAPITLDGKRLQLSANIGSLQEAEIARENGASSIGLFRTEFLFLGAQEAPDEDEQLRVYREVGRMFAPGMVVVRTLDVGGDKAVPHISFPEEANPFLGYRGVRIGLDRRELLETQLRAIFRANTEGNLKVMYPMVSSVEEMRALVDIRSTAISGLEKQDVAFNADVETGVMVEVPSVLFALDDIAPYVDFFSIGTNDLTQYLFAVDRLNESVSHYYRSFSPVVFRAIRQVIEAGQRAGIWVGICGELAGMTEALPILAGLGIDELSMSSGRIGEVLYALRRLDSVDLRTELVPKALASTVEEEVRNVLRGIQVGGEGL